MNDANRERNLACLRVIAATAAKAALDVEQRRLWEGELNEAVSAMQRALKEIKE